MKLSLSMTMLSFCVLTVGCQESAEERPDNRLINSQLVNSYNDIAIQNAIIAQHTLFPYHFVQDGAELNELGRRDLAVLTGHFMKNGGDLNVRRHDTPADLYEARVNLVRDRLQKAGIDTGRMRTSDGMPGGSGMASERILVILEDTAKGVSSGTSATYTSGTKQ
jgi:hypothetical protein